MQNPDLIFSPGLLTGWGWNDDRIGIWMDVREGVTWHDVSAFTAEDVAWSLQRAGDPASGNPIQFLWSKVTDYKVSGNRVTANKFAGTIHCAVKIGFAAHFLSA